MNSKATGISQGSASQGEMSEKDVCQAVETLLEEKKASDCVLLELGRNAPICEYFLVASATSSTHLGALAHHLERWFKEHGFRPVIKGLEGAKWVIVDVNFLMVHLFLPEIRAMYDLETLWRFIDTPIPLEALLDGECTDGSSHD